VGDPERQGRVVAARKVRVEQPEREPVARELVPVREAWWFSLRSSGLVDFTVTSPSGDGWPPSMSARTFGHL